jgi:hypothetical protein
MDRLLLFILLALLAAPAFAQSAPRCPALSEAFGHWQMTRADDYLLCQFKNDKDDVVLKAFFAEHPGIPTYGFNFYRMTQDNGHSYVWFSDRDADGQSTQIARTFMASGNGKFPILMLQFSFDNSADFDRKADIVAQLRVEP